MSNNQAPQLDRGEMTAAENANIRAAEEIMRLLARSLREHADQYPPKLRKSLSDPKAETSIEVSFNGQSVYSATLDKDQRHKEPPVNQMKESQALFLKEALSKQKGESLENPELRNMRVFVDGHKLYELKDGKVIQNDLPLEFSKSLTDMIKPKPLDLAVNNFTQRLQETLAQPMPEPELATPQKAAEVRKSAIEPEPTRQAEPSAKTEPQTSPSTKAERSQPVPIPATPSVEKTQQRKPGVPQPAQEKAAPTAAQSAPTAEQVGRPPAQPEPTAKQSHTPTVEQPKAPAVKPPLSEKPKAPAAETSQPTQATPPNQAQDSSLPRGYIPADFGIDAARGITPEKVHATNDMTLMMGYGQMQSLRYELNDIYDRANAPGFEWIRQGDHVPEMENRYSELKTAFEARLNDQIEKGKYSAPGPTAQAPAAQVQSPTVAPQAPTPQPPSTASQTSTTASAHSKTIPGLDRDLRDGQWVSDTQLNATDAQKSDINRRLINQAKVTLDLKHPNQPVGNRSVDTTFCTIKETPDSFKVSFKDSDMSIEQKGKTVTGQAQNSDVHRLMKANKAMYQTAHGKSAEAEMGD